MTIISQIHLLQALAHLVVALQEEQEQRQHGQHAGGQKFRLLCAHHLVNVERKGVKPLCAQKKQRLPDQVPTPGV